MEYSSFLFVLALASASTGVVIDLNKSTDEAFAKMNSIIRQAKSTEAHIPPGIINANVSYSENLLVGLDSMIRTGNCSVEIQDSVLRFNFHYGLQMWIQVFRSMKIDGEDMSVVFRIRNNSVHFGFTLYNATKCKVVLDELRYERLTDVEFSASKPEYDGIDVDEFFQKDVLEALNKKIDSLKKRIEKRMQFVCRHIPHEKPEHLILLHRLMLDNFKGTQSTKVIAM